MSGVLPISSSMHAHARANALDDGIDRDDGALRDPFAFVGEQTHDFSGEGGAHIDRRPRSGDAADDPAHDDARGTRDVGAK